MRISQIVKRDKDLPTPKVLRPLPRLWKADPLASAFGGVIEPRKPPRPEPENPVQFDPEPVQPSLLSIPETPRKLGIFGESKANQHR